VKSKTFEDLVVWQKAHQFVLIATSSQPVSRDEIYSYRADETGCHLHSGNIAKVSGSEAR
jgi:hypothetical protein